MTRAEAAVLTAVAFVGYAATVSLLLAAAGAHEAAPAAVGAGLLAAVAYGVRQVRRADPDRAGALVAAGALALGALMFLPAFPYGSSDRDAGVYAYTAYAIERTGSLYVPDPLAGHPPGLNPVLDGQRVPGVHPTGDTALPGFFLAEPALVATAYRVAGDGARAVVDPLVGMVALAAFGLAVRRLAGTAPGALTVVLLAGTMVQVWQAKTPGPEMLAQAGVGGALLAAAVRRDGLAGVLTTFVWVARPDGVLAVLLGLVAGRRSRAYLRGLAAAAPVALWQTYLLAGDYAARNGIPRWPVLLAVGGAAFAAAPVAHRLAPRVAPLLPGAAAAFYALLLVRQVLSPLPPPLRPGAAPKGYDVYALSRIAGLVSWGAIAATLPGVRAAVRDRRTWLLLAPAVLGAPYLVDPRISPDLMFWGRRFVPTLLPAVAILAALGIVRLLRHRRLAPVGLAMLVLAVTPYAQSWPLRGHHEYDGTLAAARVAAEASGGEQAVYLWVRPVVGCCDQPAYLFAGAVWLRYGKASMTVSPAEAPAQAAAAAALPRGWPVFVVGEGTAPPIAGHLTRVAHHETVVPVWERGGLRRPERARQVRVEFTVWRYSATTP